MTTSGNAAPPLRVAVGERFGGKYVVTHAIGAGGMSIVVAARHEQLGQSMAVKFLAVPASSERTAVTRFFQEARAAASLRSEHIVRVTDAGTDESGRPFIAMEHLEGADLGAVLKEQGPLAADVAVGYVLHACEGIAEAHAAGIVHRDLKPENLFVTRRIDGTPFVKVLDFGISKILSSASTIAAGTQQQELSRPNAFLGTPLYMSPEQLRTPGNVDGRTDVWALGVILFELLTGVNPFSAPTAPEVFAAILIAGDPPPLATLRPELPPALVAIVTGCLQRDASRRTARVGVLAEALLPWAPIWARDAGTRASRLCGEGTPPPTAFESNAEALHPADGSRPDPKDLVGPTPTSGRGRRLAAVAALALVAAGALFFTWTQGHGRASSTQPVPAGAAAGAEPTSSQTSSQTSPQTSPQISPTTSPTVSAERPIEEARAKKAAAPPASSSAGTARGSRGGRTSRNRTSVGRETSVAPGAARPTSGVDPLEGRE